MKRSEELLGLAIISIEDGREVGRVCDLVVNPAKGQVEYLIVDNGSRYTGVKVLPFKAVEGVGEYAVTVQSLTSITELAGEPETNRLLDLNVRVKGTKVLTKKGRLIGAVNEFLIDEDNEGKIAGCEVAPVSSDAGSGMVEADSIITFGQDVLVITEDVQLLPPGGPSGKTDRPSAKQQPAKTGSAGTEASSSTSAPAVKNESAAVSETAAAPVDAAEDEGDAAGDEDGQEQSPAAKLFEERQRQYLLGRKVSRRLETDSGELVADEGDLITEELLDKAKTAGKFTELSMNTKA